MKKKIEKNELRRFRRLQDYTQELLAKIIGSRQVYISYWETGKRRVPKKMRGRISAALRIPEELLFPDTDRAGQGVLDEKSKHRP